MENQIDIVVRSTEIDEMGHVNNAKYLEYIEWGREDWYERCGLPFDKITKMNIGTVTVNININYRREARKGDHLTIVTRPHKKGRTSFVLAQEVKDDRDQLIADAHVTTVTMDLKTRRSVPLPHAFSRVFLA